MPECLTATGINTKNCCRIKERIRQKTALLIKIWEKPKMKSFKSSASIFILSLSMIACAGQMRSIISPESSKGDGKAPNQISFSRFPDLPMPVKAELNMTKTLVFGTNDEWIGRIEISSSHTPNSIFDFYKQEMAGFEWQEITSVRSDSSVMTFTRFNRVATIQIASGTLGGSKVTITVSPKGAEEFPPTETPIPK